MNCRERVIESLSHRQPTKVPYNLEFTKASKEKMAAFYNDSEFESKLGNCLTLLPGRPKHTWKQIKPKCWQDDFGTVWDCTQDADVGVPSNQLVNLHNINDFQLPDPCDSQRYRGYEEKIAAGKDTLVVANFSMCLFERAYILAGMENLLMAMASDKDFVNTLLDKLLMWNLEVIEQFCSFKIDAILFGDDFGQQNGLIMSPQHWRQYIKPRIKQMYRATKEKGLYVFIHSCGQICEILDELIECGVDVYGPFQPEAVDVFDVKKQFGERVSFYGGISTQKTLPFGTPTDVRSEISRLLDEIGRGGGYIAGPAHKVSADAKPENIAVMIEILQNQ